MIMQELMKIGFSDVRKLYTENGSLKNIQDIDSNTAGAISSIESFEEYEGRGNDREYIGDTKKIKLYSKEKALELLGKQIGMFKDKVDVSQYKPFVVYLNVKDLERSIIRTSLEFYPKEVASYNSSKHIWRFKNGSIIDFGYIDNENDVYQYQSAEYDVIRFDELTHFTEYMYVYMISRCRGANPYPKYIKSSTNPRWCWS